MLRKDVDVHGGGLTLFFLFVFFAGEGGLCFTRALHTGLNLVERSGCSPITVETDSLELVQAYNGFILIEGGWGASILQNLVAASPSTPSPTLSPEDTAGRSPCG